MSSPKDSGGLSPRGDKGQPNQQPAPPPAAGQKPQNGPQHGKKKPLSRQERIAKAKAKKTQAQTVPLKTSGAQFDDPSKRKKVSKKQILPLQLSKKQVNQFSHLPQYEGGASVGITIQSKGLHPDIVKLGLLYQSRIIQGSHSRAAAMLTAFKTVLLEYEPSPDKSLAMDLDIKLKPIIQYLTDSRPISIGMGNAIKFFKTKVGNTGHISDAEAKKYLIGELDRYLEERIVVADEVIKKHGVTKISNGDVILTYASSRVVQGIIMKAYDMGIKFKVILVDSRPKYEGKALLKRLIKHGLDCTYVLLTAISYIMKGVSKVLMGATAMLSNGAMVSRVGSAVVAMMANAHNVPVIVATETYKFTERVQLDSICFNELDDPDDLVTTETLKGWKEVPNLKLLNLAYDVTPIDYVQMVITEVGMIPPTSVPAVLREYRADITRL